MSLRSRLTSLCAPIQHVKPSMTGLRAGLQQQQLRNLNHFISRTPDTLADESAALRLAVKDNIATHHLPTTCGSNTLKGYQSPVEATIVRQLRERCGAVLVGKTNLDEFGMGSHSMHSAFGAVAQGTDRPNVPSMRLLSAGGSSGGSAVAVQIGEADLALGTDTGGSVRLPAAYCGIVGYKPSYGMVSRFGVVPYANSLDTVGFLAREVKTIRAVVAGEMGIMQKHDPLDPSSLSEASRRQCVHRVKVDRREIPEPLEQITIGIPMEYNIKEIEPRVRRAWQDTAIQLEAAGAKIVPVSLPSTRHALSAYYVIAPAEASSNLAKYDGVRYGNRPEGQTDGTGDVLYSATRGVGFGEEVKRRILLGSYSLSSAAMNNYFIQAQKVRQLVKRDFDRSFRLRNPLMDEDDQQFSLADLPESVKLENKLGPAQVDFLLCPTAPTVAPTLQEVAKQTSLDAYMNDVFTVPASLAGLPAISVPAKMPAEAESAASVAGLQLIGQYWDDERLLLVAQQVEQMLR